MLIVFLNWLYIFLITQIIGMGFYQCIKHLIKSNIKCRISGNTVCGIVITTIFAQFFSLFYKVGFIANVILLILSAFCIILCKKIYRNI